MTLYSVAVRFLDDRPDKDGYTSAFGREIPLFYVDATTHTNALSIVGELVKGRTDVTRTFVDVCNVYEDGASVLSRTFYAAGWDAQRVRDINTIRVVTQYAKGGYVTNGDIFAEEDADTVTLFAEDGTNVLSVAKTSRGNWRIDSSDNGHNIKVSWYDVRRGTAEMMIEYVAVKWAMTFERVDSFDDAPASV